ncbi:hypothetical protein QVH35_02200 [Candidatus Nitrosotenuis chungbukensis]|uniref:hypothetical protein n=1 Tax=Candidatus Nitrosotenuis chungbukensis TaxID=1353246 RepID=UPI0026710D9B|nr:hypothetical protein [Candidatus Nitrosotenuis chungbukensis]WKT58294.1 hypothetical protein QVH35_02200 [Candidatus Nitrosotenuis chungbukensis]
MEKNISNKKPIFIINSINPIIDFELIKNLLIHFKTKNHNLIPLGAIPGTSPEIVVNADSLTSYFTNPQLVIQSATPIYWDTQRKYNNQFNLARPLRLKIFLKLLQTIDSLHRISIEHFIKKLESQEIFNFILDYGESNLHIKEIKKCPYCASRNLKPIFCGTSQPALGYLPSSQYFYIECMDCQLVLLRRQCHVNDIHRFYDIYERPPIDQEQVIEDLVSNKGGSHFDEKLKVLDIMEKLMDRDAKVVDIGGGFGEFSCLVKKEILHGMFPV